MTAPIHFESIEYRVVVVVPASRKVLMCRSNGSLGLLRVTIPVKARPARHLCRALRSIWGLSVLILDHLASSSPCVVAELIDGRNSWSFHPVDIAEIPSTELSDEERAFLTKLLAGEGTAPCARIGWIDEAIGWIVQTTGQRPCPKDEIEQFNAGGPFALLRFPMLTGNSYWLKATGGTNAHERRLTQVLSDLASDSLPKFLSAKATWNAWLTVSQAQSLSAMPTELNELLELLGAAVETLASLQTKTAGKESVLLEAGAFDQRLSAMRGQAGALFDHVAEAMALQTSTKAPKLKPQRVVEIQRVFEDACRWAESHAIPETIIHNDMNLGNLAFTEHKHSCQLLDWAEGCVGHPLVTLEHLLLLNPIAEPHTRSLVNRALKDRYRFAMREVCDPSAIEEGFRFAPLLAAASTLYGRGAWLLSGTPCTESRYAYSRMLARYMDRAATDLSLQEASCH